VVLSEHEHVKATVLGELGAPRRAGPLEGEDRLLQVAHEHQRAQGTRPVQHVQARELELGRVLGLIQEEFIKARRDRVGDVRKLPQELQRDAHRVVGRQDPGVPEDRGLSTRHLGADRRDDLLLGPGNAARDLRDDQPPIGGVAEPVQRDPLLVVAMDTQVRPAGALVHERPALGPEQVGVGTQDVAVQELVDRAEEVLAELDGRVEVAEVGRSQGGDVHGG
jgi:hypothetical protein